MSELPKVDLGAMQVGFDNERLTADFDVLRAHGGDLGLVLIDREMQSIFADARGLVRGYFGDGRIHRHLERATTVDTATQFVGSFEQKLDRGTEEVLVLERLQSPYAEGTHFFDTVRLAVSRYVSSYRASEYVEPDEPDGLSPGGGDFWMSVTNGKDLVVVTTDFELANENEVIVEESVPSTERFYFDKYGNRQYELSMDEPGPDEAETVHRVTETVKGSSGFLREDITRRLIGVKDGIRIMTPRSRGEEPRVLSVLPYNRAALRAGAKTVRQRRPKKQLATQEA